MAEFRRVASRAEIPEGEGRCVEVEGRRIAVFQVDGRFYALDDECTHQGGPLSEGFLEGGRVVCPWHGACFDLGSGEAVEPPADEPVQAYSVRVNGEDVEVEL